MSRARLLGLVSKKSLVKRKYTMQIARLTRALGLVFNKSLTHQSAPNNNATHRKLYCWAEAQPTLLDFFGAPNQKGVGWASAQQHKISPSPHFDIFRPPNQ